jgi:predicted DsbA family dithiol-disulfide isomerase
VGPLLTPRSPSPTRLQTRLQGRSVRNIPPVRRVPTDVNVEIFSDVVCPWCAVGKRRFETALRSFAHAEEIDVVWRAFELDPDAPVRREGDYADRLARKYGMSRQQAETANKRLTDTAAAEGLDFHFERAQPGNTFDAHRLLHYARSAGAGIQDALKERLFVAYFTEGAPIGETETLVRVAVDVGLDEEASRAVLAGDEFSEEVRADEREAVGLGVTGVPFFVVDGKFGIPGAQDSDTILRVLDQAWAKAHPEETALTTIDDTTGGNACEDGACAV